MKDIANYLFNIAPTKTMSPRAGRLFVSDPFLKDEMFTHAVMTVIDHEVGEGTTAVVLNNRTKYKLADLLEGVDPDSDIPVFCGGTAGQDRLFFIHTLGPEVISGAREYAPGLYIGGSFEDVVEYVNGGFAVEGAIRFFLGYTNWVDDEFERAIARGKWVGAPGIAMAEDVLIGAGDSFWHRTVKSLGEYYRPWSLLPRNAVCN